MELEILKRFREDENPALGEIEGKRIETLSREELIKLCKKQGIDPVKLCHLGAIDPRQENLCVILSYAMECKDKAVASGSADPDEGASEMPPKKKARTLAEVS